jgi:sirohydrochlorin cobaltochelatase
LPTDRAIRSWRAPVEAVAREVARADAGVLVACAYLELSEPDLPTAAARLVAEGASHIRVLPLFFGMGKHAREDLPAVAAALAQPTRGALRAACPPPAKTPADRLLARIALEPAP